MREQSCIILFKLKHIKIIAKKDEEINIESGKSYRGSA